MRAKLPKKGNYIKRTKKINTRVWHHLLTLSRLAGSTAEAFANYHISLGWPGCGYHLVIEPKNIIQTPKGTRYRIVYANDVNFKTGTVDGAFGPKLKDALTRFQKFYLPYKVDGVYGPNTRKKLQAVLKSKGY